jgi:hypothetical protein
MTQGGSKKDLVTGFEYRSRMQDGKALDSPDNGLG